MGPNIKESAGATFRIQRSASAGEHRRLMQKGVIADLFDEEIRHVGARDEPAFPVAWIDRQAALRPRL